MTIHVHDLAPASHDPTGTTMLRRRFVAGARRRWAALNTLAREAILKHGMLGAPTVQSIGLAASAPRGDLFVHWFGEAMRQTVMGGDGSWTGPYIAQAAGMAQRRAQGLVVTDGAPLSLYVHRPVLNGADIVAWAKEQGFKTTLSADDMHVTVVFSRAPVDWAKVRDDTVTELVTVGTWGGRSLENFGEAVVLRFASASLAARHDEVARLGASWDHPTYQPHVTLTWNVGDFDWRSIAPYAGPIILGPEKFAPVKENWKSTITEDGAPDLHPVASPSLPTLTSVTASELRGICDAVAQQVARAIGHGTLSRAKPPQLASAISGVIKSAGMARTNAMINFYVVKAFAAATIDVFREQGVERVGTIAERVPKPLPALDALFDKARITPQKRHARTGRFVKFARAPTRKERAEIERGVARLARLGEVAVETAEDDAVCPRCEKISEDGPYDIDDVLSLVPAHVHCRCVLIPRRDESGRFAGRAARP